MDMARRAFTEEFNLLALTDPEWRGAALNYQEIVTFLNRSRISYAISANQVVSRPYLEQFWDTTELDYRATPNVIIARVAKHRIAISEATIREVLQFNDLATDPVQYPEYMIDGCWRQIMGYVGRRNYPSFKKMWLLDQWRYFAHVMIMSISARKAGKDAMGHDLESAMVEPIPMHTPLFGHLIDEAYIAPQRERWCHLESEPELSEHSDEEEENDNDNDSDDDNGDDGNGDEGDSGAGYAQKPDSSESERTVTDSSDSEPTPEQRHPRKNIQESLHESSSRRRRRESSDSNFQLDSSDSN
ncbi:hypothetical protein L1987_78348 [Smallanthus sonchifolius]|uniref:Uncharacterized protein n=1 Tax=Smallanthus sonchifolius TaxID=185202 RepID=A0ACB8ZCM9_9ASTR|nr:hypothetical protein L1987_78348 [Smallanthus sonchifolius]